MAENTRTVVTKCAGAGAFGAWNAGQTVTLPAEVATAMLAGGYATEVPGPPAPASPAKRAVEDAKKAAAGPEKTTEGEKGKGKAKGEKKAGGRRGLPPMPKFGK